MTAQAVKVAVGAFVLALVLAGCTSDSGTDDSASPTTTSRAGVRLTDLTSVEQLRKRFNSDRGTPRLLLLLSPT